MDHKFSAQVGADPESSGALKNICTGRGFWRKHNQEFFMLFLYLPIISQCVYVTLKIRHRNL